jgi:hypothetical protein
MTLSDLLGAIIQIALVFSFCGLVVGGVAVLIRFGWVAAPHYASYKFSPPSSTSTREGEGGPTMPDGLSWDIINACRAPDGRVIRKQLCERSGRQQGGVWYQHLKTFLDYHNL